MFNLTPDLDSLLSAEFSTDAIVDHEGETIDVWLIDPGLGPAWYMTRQGRILVDGSYWDESPIRPATEDESIQILVAVSRKRSLPRLLTLLPSPPSNHICCNICKGERFVDHGTNPGITLVCHVCHGRGWTTQVGAQ